MPGPRTDCNATFRQRPFRFLGYGMAFGEALRYVVGTEVSGVTEVCAAVAVVFAASHVMCEIMNDANDGKKILRALLWEILATSLPAMVVYFLAGMTWLAVSYIPVELLSKVVPSVVGLCTCALIQKTMDKIVDDAMEVIFGEVVLPGLTDGSVVSRVSQKEKVAELKEKVAEQKEKVAEQKEQVSEQKEQVAEQKEQVAEEL